MDGHDPKSPSNNKDSLPSKNRKVHQAGIGLHFAPIIWRPIGGLNDFPILLQGTYKRELEHFKLRGGIGGGPWVSLESTRSPSYDLSMTYFFGANAGLEKRLWKIGEHFELNLGLDMIYYWRGHWGEYNSRTRAYAFGLTLAPEIPIDPRNSISIEFGLGYGKYWGWDDYSGEKAYRTEGDPFFLPYRLGTFSYHFRF